ncbi:cytosolic iron-sulfur assembly component 2B-like [Pollicipes pollicipes]|uniref:cytosolic iron-sulfur assembly component 2B-like n=1 Tax=Pollicipes pollicipes TaxID=41117 RepID=UPI00188529BA|nr:cytosolic iron-sulfur assembly component 2B-like [Pollicipes pollicipes]
MAATDRLENVNPQIFCTATQRPVTSSELDDEVADPIDAREVFDLIRDINDPEHPLTLEQLNVVEERLVEVDPEVGRVQVYFTPTIPHCSMATLIGLSIKVKLERSLPARFKLDVLISPGSHASERAVNKQLADKERVAAATENGRLLEVVNQCLVPPSSAEGA